MNLDTAFIIATLVASIRAGTPILYATIGEILAERSGILNLGVEGMMLMGAVTGFIVGLKTGSPWMGVIAGMLAGGILSLFHAFVSVTLRGHQVVSGLALTLLGMGLSSFMGKPYIGVKGVRFVSVPIPLLSKIPFFGPILFNHDVLVYFSYLLIPAVWFFIYKTRPGLHLRAVGEDPATADVNGINVSRTRYLYTFVGGLLAGLGGAAISLAYTPGWIEGMTAGRGWIAVGLVIFAFWDPVQAAIGSYLFGGIQSLQFGLQTKGVTIPIYFLQMMPYAFTILVLMFASQESLRKRIGSPAALGVPYVRGERGK